MTYNVFGGMLNPTLLLPSPLTYKPDLLMDHGEVSTSYFTLASEQAAFVSIMQCGTG